MRDYIRQRKPTYDELYLQACQQMIDWSAAMNSRPNYSHWFYVQLKDNINHYGKLAKVVER